MIQITDEIFIAETELEESFSRASGPGGQNVNKVSTAVVLRFNANDSPNLPEAVRQRLIRLAGKKMTEDGFLIIQARRFRTRERNRQDARDRLVALIQKAAREPKPRKRTKPSKVAVERRLQKKKRRSDIKARRSRVSEDD